MGWLEGGALSRNQGVRTSSNGTPRTQEMGSRPGPGGSYPSSHSSPEETQEPKRGPDTQSQPRHNSGSCFLYPRLRGKGSGRTDRPRGRRFKPSLLGLSPLPPLEKVRLLGVSGLGKGQGETFRIPDKCGSCLPCCRTGLVLPVLHRTLGPAQGLVLLRCSMHSKRIP